MNFIEICKNSEFVLRFGFLSLLEKKDISFYVEVISKTSSTLRSFGRILLVQLVHQNRGNRKIVESSSCQFVMSGRFFNENIFKILDLMN